MAKYKVTNFNEKTPKAEQTKLESSIKALGGVETVKLSPQQGEVSFTHGKQAEPNMDMIKSAVQKAGFTLGAKI